MKSIEANSRIETQFILSRAGFLPLNATFTHKYVLRAGSPLFGNFVTSRICFIDEELIVVCLLKER